MNSIRTFYFLFDSLCEGKHVCYNGVAPCPLVKFDGSKGNKDYRITSNKAVLYRYDSWDDITMATGTLNKVRTLYINRPTKEPNLKTSTPMK